MPRRAANVTWLPRFLQPVLYWSIYYSVMALFTLIYRIRRLNTGRIPRRGACLLVANHQSHLDPPLVSMCNPYRQTHFVARLGLFAHGPFAWLITSLNSIPVSEEESDVGAIREILARLEQGVPVILFPEGSRTEDGAMQPFKRGVALLLKRAKCPVVPIAVEGCYDTWPRNRRFPRFWGCRVGASVGVPIAAEELLKDGPDAGLARLAGEIETLRLDLRSRLRAATKGRFPLPGLGDERSPRVPGAASVQATPTA